ncbi:hypothetical protein [Desulfothermus okinawensis]
MNKETFNNNIRVVFDISTMGINFINRHKNIISIKFKKFFKSRKIVQPLYQLCPN